MNKPRLHTAANGHAAIDFEEYDSPEWFEAVFLLESEQGFQRTGEAVMVMDEGVMPSFVKGEISIEAGWNNWSGNYLLSASKDGDEVIKWLFQKLFG
jgi:hypothetical protein